MTTYEELRDDLRRHTLIGVNKGWEPVVVNLHGELLKLNDPQYSVTQIKEKFGGLRFYFTIGKENFRISNEIVSAAEAIASKICEVCGRPGHLRTERAWLLTLCDDHNVDEPFAWDSGYSAEEKKSWNADR